jgi:hypothetical protein
VPRKTPGTVFFYFTTVLGPGSSLILAVEWAIHSPVFYAGDLPRVSIGNDKRKTKQIKITFRLFELTDLQSHSSKKLTQTISNEEHIEKIIDDIIRLVLI